MLLDSNSVVVIINQNQKIIREGEFIAIFLDYTGRCGLHQIGREHDRIFQGFQVLHHNDIAKSSLPARSLRQSDIAKFHDHSARS